MPAHCRNLLALTRPASSAEVPAWVRVVRIRESAGRASTCIALPARRAACGEVIQDLSRVAVKLLLSRTGGPMTRKRCGALAELPQNVSRRADDPEPGRTTRQACWYKTGIGIALAVASSDQQLR